MKKSPSYRNFRNGNENQQEQNLVGNNSTRQDLFRHIYQPNFSGKVPNFVPPPPGLYRHGGNFVPPSTGLYRHGGNFGPPPVAYPNQVSYPNPTGTQQSLFSGINANYGPPSTFIFNERTKVWEDTRDTQQTRSMCEIESESTFEKNIFEELIKDFPYIEGLPGLPYNPFEDESWNNTITSCAEFVLKSNPTTPTDNEILNHPIKSLMETNNLPKTGLSLPRLRREKGNPIVLDSPFNSNGDHVVKTPTKGYSIAKSLIFKPDKNGNSKKRMIELKKQFIVTNGSNVNPKKSKSEKNTNLDTSFEPDISDISESECEYEFDHSSGIRKEFFENMEALSRVAREISKVPLPGSHYHSHSKSKRETKSPKKIYHPNLKKDGKSPRKEGKNRN